MLIEKSLTVVLNPVHSVGNLSWPSSVYSRYRSKLKPDLFVEIYVDQKQIARSKTIKKNLEPKWDEVITMYVGKLGVKNGLINLSHRPSAQESSNLVMKLKHKSTLPSDPCFGVIKVTVGQLLRLSKGPEGALI